MVASVGFFSFFPNGIPPQGPAPWGFLFGKHLSVRRILHRVALAGNLVSQPV